MENQCKEETEIDTQNVQNTYLPTRVQKGERDRKKESDSDSDSRATKQRENANGKWKNEVIVTLMLIER